MAWLISCVLDMILIFDDFQSELCRLPKWWSIEGRGCWGCWLLIPDIEARTVAATYLPSVRKAARFTAASTSHHRRSSSVRWAVNSKPICLAEVKLYCVTWCGDTETRPWPEFVQQQIVVTVHLLSFRPAPPRLAICQHCTMGHDLLTSPRSHRIITNRARAGNEPSRSVKFYNHGEGPF